MPNIFQTLLEQPPISRIRRNHGLEHATIHLLTRKFPKTSLAGHSDAGGFWLMGEVPTEAVREAAQDALNRMRAGEHDLAVHPNCGTNFVTTGSAAGMAAAVTMFGAGRRWRDKLERLPLAMTVATLTLILAQPLGFLLQERVTTSGHPGNLEIVEVVPSRRGRIRAHRVTTQG
jgi:hypothetical protein